MKVGKWIILLVLLVVVAQVWWYVSTFVRVTPPWRQPKFGVASVGDIRVPISAAGVVQPKQVIEIKPEAFGPVEQVSIFEGKTVREGDVMVVLDKVDEQRNVDRAETEVTRFEALVAQAKVAIEQAKAQVTDSESRIEEAKANLKRADFDFRRIDVLKQRGGTFSEQEHVAAESQARVAAAKVIQAEQALKTAHHRVATEYENEKIQNASLSDARTRLADAKERLAETTIVAPADAMVTKVQVEKGMIVQSGTQSITGGTIVAMLADMSELKVVARVDESDYGRVLDISPIDALPQTEGLREAARADAETLARRSGKVRVTVDAFPNDVFEGTIKRVEPQGELNPGASIIQFDVHVVISDERAFMLPLGSQAQVEFTVESALGVLRVPTEAMQNNEGTTGVWIKTPPLAGTTDKFGKRFVRCKFGISDGEYVEIAQILDEPGALEDGMDVFTKLPPEDDD